MNASNRILILDDQECVGITICQMAEKIGLKAESTTCPNKFLHNAAHEPLSCLIIDLIMPEVSGDQIIRELARTHSQTPLVLMSGGDGRVLWAAERAAKEYGLNVLGALEKPFFLKSLKKILDRLPKKRRIALPPEAVNVPVLDAEIVQQGIKNNEFFTVYQPKVDSSTQSLVGFEVLLRWFNPHIGAIAPDIFIEAIEQLGLIDDLTEYMFERALSWFSQHTKYIGKINLNLALNISPLSLDSPHLFERLTERCNFYGVKPQAVTLEITEAHAMRNAVTSLDMLLSLRLKGFKLSIDDFGTGYSSLKQLVRLPFSELKIDKSFVSIATASSEARHVIKTIIDMARALHLITVAEGVECKEVLNLLQIYGCDQIQGYFIEKPLNGADMNRWLERRREKQWAVRTNAAQMLKSVDMDKEEELASVTALITRLLNVEYASVFLFSGNSVVCAASIGLKPESKVISETFCQCMVSREDAVVINSNDELAQDYKLPDSWGRDFHFYGGYPIYSKTGLLIGSLCTLHNRPISINEASISVLKQSAELLELLIAQSTKSSTGKTLLKSQFERVDRILNIVKTLGYQVTFLVIKPHWQESPHSLRWQLEKLELVLRKSCRRSDIVIRLSEREYAVVLVHKDGDGIENIIMERAGQKLNQLQKRFDSWCFLGVDFATTKESSDYSAQSLMAQLSPY